MRSKALLSLAAVVAILVVCAVCSLPAAAISDSGDDDRLLYTSGTGKVTTSPDIATVSVAVETESSDAKTAQQENAIRMERCIGAIKALGLDDKSIETTGYRIYSTEDEKSVSGPFDTSRKIYVVTNTVLVTLDNIDMVGSVIDAAVGSGANQINYITFSLSDEKAQSLRDQAISAAVTQARADADAVSAALGMRIAGVKEVHVGQSYNPVEYASDAMYSSKTVGSGVPTPIQEQSVDVTASVSVTYVII